jgi:hypothetical protein
MKNDPGFEPFVPDYSITAPTTPPGTRLLLASEDLLSQFGTRTADGRRLSFEWGEPSPEGWYEPVITATDDGYEIVPVGLRETAEAFLHHIEDDRKCDALCRHANVLRAALAASEEER